MGKAGEQTPAADGETRSGPRLSVQFWGWAGLALGLVFLLYWPARTFEKINYDDPQLIFHEARVSGGLNWQNAGWALVSREERNWTPLARWSHQLDASLFDTAEGPPHLVSSGIQVLNCLLLMLLLRRLGTGDGVAILGALAWAVHPVQVESVCWLSNRKHLLATACAFAACLNWWRARPDRPPRGAWAAFFLALSLMARPTAALLPVIWLLEGRLRHPRRPTPRRWLVVCGIISATAIAVTLWAQSLPESPLRSVPTLADGPWLACTGSAHLARCLIWPSNLAFHYPVPASIPWGQVAMGAVLLGTAAVLGWRWRKTHPLATLGLACAGAAWLPASGLLPAGELLTADRFAMLPSAGLILAAIARSSRLVSRIAPWISRGAVIGMIVAWGVVSRQQIMLWKDTPTLFGSAIARQPSDPLPRVQLGLWHLALGDVSAGEEFLRKAVEADPGCLLARYNLAVSALHALRPDEARQNAEILTRERPDFAEGHWLLSQAHFQLADLPRALAEAQAALRADPTHLPARARVAELTARRPPPSRDRRPRKQPP